MNPLNFVNIFLLQFFLYIVVKELNGLTVFNIKFLIHFSNIK